MRVDEFDGFPGAIARCYEYGNLIVSQDFKKALRYYEEELHRQIDACEEKQRPLILNNLADNILRVHHKKWSSEHPNDSIVPPYVSSVYPEDLFKVHE